MFLLAGVFGIAVSLGLFWYCLPKNGRLNASVGTIAEPYVAIAITIGLVLSLGAIAAEFIGLL